MGRLGVLGLIAVAFVTLVAGSPAMAERRLALVIGNSDYADTPLLNPVNDARLLTDTLASFGFEVHAHSNLDQRGIKRAVADYGAALDEAGSDTVSVIYYAGHGIQVKGRNYLVPVGSEIKHERDVPIEAVAADEILASLAFANTRLNIVILDACRNNPYARGFRSADRGLAKMDAPQGTLLAYSTAPGSIAADGEGRHSPYSLALVRSMNRPGLSIEEVFKRTRIDVLERTAGLQVPWEASSLTGNFSFIPGATTSSGEDASSDPETVFWASIADKEDPALFEDYLKHYPSGLYSSIAKHRLAALSADPVLEQSRTAVETFDGPVRFATGDFKPNIIRGETECSSIRFHEVSLNGESGEGRWTHSEARGTVRYSVKDGIIGVKFRGAQINRAKETVQVQGRNLLVRLHIKHVDGSCKVAFILKGAITQ